MTIAPDGYGSDLASCNEGERATGGGHYWTVGDGRDVQIASSLPAAGASGVPYGWWVEAHNMDFNGNNTGNLTIRVYVVCAAP